MDISSWMIDNITVASPTGAVDGYGQPVYATARTVACRLEYSRKLVTEPNGNEIEAKHRISTDQEITWEDLIWLPGEDSDTAPSKRPLVIERASTKSGAYTIWEARL